MSFGGVVLSQLGSTTRPDEPVWRSARDEVFASLILASELTHATRTKDEGLAEVDLAWPADREHSVRRLCTFHFGWRAQQEQMRTNCTGRMLDLAVKRTNEPASSSRLLCTSISEAVTTISRLYFG